MNKYIVLFISLRYIHGYTSDIFGRLVSWLSIIGITLGVMALITLLSVMNGFEKKIEKNILNFIPQALITHKKGSINPKDFPKSITKQLKGIYHVSPLIISNVILQSTNNIALGTMIGVYPNEINELTPFLINTKQEKLKANHYNVIIGSQLANQLKVNYGDILRLIIPNINQFTPIGYIPNQRLFTIIGTFYTNTEVDNYQLLINQQDALHLMHYPDQNITGWRLFFKKPLMIDDVNKQILPKNLEWKDWREHKGELFKAIHMEKNMMSLLLSLIIIVSTFNIITSLSLLVLEKKSEIAILQTQGITRIKIMMIFIIQGSSNGIIGSFLGSILGIFITYNINYILPIFNTLIDITSIPIEINLIQIIIITIISILISVISTLYPSWCASNIHPSEALRYE
ncbi:Lipoprotein-releasing system transmembrane protein LolC [Serratia symbiotica]|nr:Lipoprotein-releasing system transmembrane protein LolC [Serratia symbiotica]